MRLVTAKDTVSVPISRKREVKAAGKEDRSRLARLAEEMSIPWKELNKIAKEVVSREFGDCRFLSVMENRQVRGYLRKNYEELSERYRKMVWN